MSKIKENPIKFVKLFSLLYLGTNIITRILYYVVVALTFSVSLNIPMFVSVITSVIPIILFIVYIFMFYGTNKTQVLLPISYIVSIVMNLFSLIQNIDDIQSVLFGIISLGISVFLVIDCFSDFKRLNISKKLVIIGAGVSCFSIILNFVLSVLKGYGLYGFYIISYLISLSGIFSMLAYIIFWNFAIDKRNTSSLEDNLVSLKQRYENGDITEQEFNERKAEILNKL